MANCLQSTKSSKTSALICRIWRETSATIWNGWWSIAIQRFPAKTIKTIGCWEVHSKQIVASCHRELPRSPKDHPALHCDSVLGCSVASRCQWLALVGTYCRGPIPFIGIKRVQYTWLELLWLIKGGRSNWWFSMLEKKKGFETAVHALTHPRCLRLFLLHEPWVNEKEPCAGALFRKYEPGWSGCKLSAVIRGYKFILSKIYFLLILGVFITGQSALLNHKLGKSQTLGEDIAMFSCRVFNYIFSMCKLIISALACTFPRSLHLVFFDKADAPGFSQMLEWGNKIGHLASGLCQFFFEKDWKVMSCVQLPLQPLVVCLVSDCLWRFVILLDNKANPTNSSETWATGR